MTKHTGRKAFRHPIAWTRAVNDALNELIAKQRLDKTTVCEMAGYSKNFLAKLESGAKKMISLDEIEPFAQVLGRTTPDIIALAAESHLARAREVATNQKRAANGGDESHLARAREVATR